jgi:hypothetical protein
MSVKQVHQRQLRRLAREQDADEQFRRHLVRSLCAEDGRLTVYAQMQRRSRLERSLDDVERRLARRARLIAHLESSDRH